MPAILSLLASADARAPRPARFSEQERQNKASSPRKGDGAFFMPVRCRAMQM